MNAPMDAVGRNGPWVKENSGILGRRVLTALATTIGEDASKLARRLADGQSLADVVARRGLPREAVRDAVDQELRRSGRSEPTRKADALIDHLSRRSGNDAPGLAGLAQMLGMTVAELVTALGDDGVTVQRLFQERGIVPAPGTIMDLAM